MFSIVFNTCLAGVIMLAVFLRRHEWLAGFPFILALAGVAWLHVHVCAPRQERLANRARRMTCTARNRLRLVFSLLCCLLGLGLAVLQHQSFGFLLFASGLLGLSGVNVYRGGLLDRRFDAEQSTGRGISNIERATLKAEGAVWGGSASWREVS